MGKSTSFFNVGFFIRISNIYSLPVEYEKESQDKDSINALVSEFKTLTNNYSKFFYYNNEKAFEKIYSKYEESNELINAFNKLKDICKAQPIKIKSSNTFSLTLPKV